MRALIVGGKHPACRHIENLDPFETRKREEMRVRFSNWKQGKVRQGAGSPPGCPILGGRRLRRLPGHSCGYAIATASTMTIANCSSAPRTKRTRFSKSKSLVRAARKRQTTEWRATKQAPARWTSSLPAVGPEPIWRPASLEIGGGQDTDLSSPCFSNVYRHQVVHQSILNASAQENQSREAYKQRSPSKKQHLLTQATNCASLYARGNLRSFGASIRPPVL